MTGMGAATAGMDVPLSMLASPDDAENMVTPAEGDEPEVMVRLRINSVNGENANVTPLAINGKSLTEGEEAGVPQSETAETALRGMGEM